MILTAGDCSLGLTGLKTPTLLVPLRQASFCITDAASCVCDAVFLSCGRGLMSIQLMCDLNNFWVKIKIILFQIYSIFILKIVCNIVYISMCCSLYCTLLILYNSVAIRATDDHVPFRATGEQQMTMYLSEQQVSNRLPVPLSALLG